MSIGSRIWPDEATARRNAGPGETLKVIGRTWVTAPQNVTEHDLRRDFADLIRIPTPEDPDAVR